MEKDRNIPTMTPPEVHDYLRVIGSQWTGQGVAMEVGCWLGASSCPLLEGLVEAGYDRPFWAFDRWRANASEVHRAAKEGEILTISQDLMELYLNNVKSVYEDVRTVKGRIPGILKEYTGDPIEICILDAPKQNPIFQKSMDILLPYFIPGVTILGLLDYYQYKKFEDDKQKRERLLAPVKFMKTNKDHFTMIKRWPVKCSCAFFKYEKQI